MAPPSRTILICATLLGFLFSGGLGAGACASLCIRSDGTVQVETPLNRCCSDLYDDCDPESADPMRAASVKRTECGPCVDVPLVNTTDAAPVYRLTLEGVGVHLHQAPLLAAPLAIIPDDVLGWWDATECLGAIARPLLANIVLRC